MRRFLFFQDRQEDFASIDNTPKIDAHQPFEILDRKLVESADQSDTGIVYQMSNAAVLCDNFFSKSLNLAKVGDICEVRRHPQF